MLVTHSYAAYLENVPITITQPDGTVINCFATGDEYYNWVHDADGYTMIRDKNTGYYCYAILSGDELTASQYVVGTVTPQSVRLTPNINISGEKMLERRNAIIQNSPQYAARQNSGTPTRGGSKGKINNIVIYIRFADQLEEFPPVQATYTSMFNDTTIGANSMRNYFREVSYGQLDIESHFYPVNNGTTIFSYQDIHNRDYYCPYHAVSNPSGYMYDEPLRKHKLLTNAMNSVAHLIPPSLDIDIDNDGYVDNICFIIRGATSDWNTLLWPHMSSLYWPQPINGKNGCFYNLQLENDLTDSGNGVLCHEMGHSLGAPDLYHYNTVADAAFSFCCSPVGSWDVMALPKNPPQHMGAHMKHRYGGWISMPVITISGTYTLLPLTPIANSSGQYCYKIPIAGSSQYLVVEYRKKMGIFESSVPHSGLIIYRINESYKGNSNGVGPNGVSDEVYIFRPGIPVLDPDGNLLFEDGSINSANFSQASGNTKFSNSTNPHCFLSDGSLCNITIKNIQENPNGTLSFDIKFCNGVNVIYTNNSTLPPWTTASNSIQTQGTVVVKNAKSVTFEAGNEIILGPGFEVELGGTFEINMVGCEE